MLAILSDIHGNLEALTAVLADVEDEGIGTVYNLGDMIGYGPNPTECLDLSRRMDMVLKGNLDDAVLNAPDGFGVNAEKSVFWTQSQLRNEPDSVVRMLRAEYLAGLLSSHREGPTLFVHGSARNPQNEYVFPEDIHNEEKMKRIGAAFDQLCFAGHTHVPGLFVERSLGSGIIWLSMSARVVFPSPVAD